MFTIMISYAERITHVPILKVKVTLRGHSNEWGLTFVSAPYNTEHHKSDQRK